MKNSVVRLKPLMFLLAFCLPVAAIAEPSSVQINGVVESVILSKQMIKVTHDPVEAWGWPKMKMKFDVAQSVDLRRFQEGQQVEMTVDKASGKPVITAIE